MRNSNSFVDDVIGGIDRSLKTLTGGHSGSRPNPGAEQQEPKLSDEERKHVAGLMRVNHAGEICAQALYEGQALTAKSASAKASLLHAASEEQDHLSWCRQRLDQLDARPSVFDPLFYFCLNSYRFASCFGCLHWQFGLCFWEPNLPNLHQFIGKN